MCNISRLLDAQQRLSDYCKSDNLCVDGLLKRIERFLQIEGEGTMGSGILTSTGRLLLHHACMNERVTADIVRLLIHNFPGAAGGQDEKEFQPVPLHVACWNHNTTAEIIRLLIDAFPQSVCRQSIDGGMPLHYLCCGDCADSINVLRLLLEAYPEAVDHLNQGGMLPIHLACMGSKPAEFCQVLADAYPQLDDESTAGDADVIDRESTEYLECVFNFVRAHPEML